MIQKPMNKPYWEMTTAELREATREFDAEFVPTRRLSARMRAEVARAKSKLPGRPVVGKGAERVLITVERGLLKQTDAYAKKRGLSRSQLIAEGLRNLLSAA